MKYNTKLRPTFKGRFLKFRMNNTFANLFSSLSESFLHKEITKIQ